MGTDPVAILPYDPALFGQAANNGQMLIELQPKAAGSEAVRRLARALTGRTAAANEKNPVRCSRSSKARSRREIGFNVRQAYRQ